ncbi:unnamed protein product [Rotaria magnacalcarata]|uniref:CCHC-type domain-containing protein n=1 Tax=Rotaria magnacalcarata TaxID=392030 RepID=A0A816ZF68_9BILA|nr:unnamed protein product [Rotaria magnacalcarata]CAF3934849.1 unnamed protein product [Rotaria magnacalcarata]CAF4453288.1 unnamed protein product [Rotaria magnacalcarata]
MRVTPQHTVIIKWVNNSFTDDDVREELNMKFESLFSIESMQGTMNERNRHIKVEMFNKKECNKLLNSGKVNLGGLMHSADEFLPSPRILICNRCNLPGHTKKTCSNSDVDLCRRCGLKTTIHPIISSAAVTDNLSETIKSLSEDLKEEKERHEAIQKQIEDKYMTNVQMMTQTWMFVKQMKQTQEMMISSMNKTLNQVMFPICSKSTDIIRIAITKLKTRVRNLEIDDVVEIVNNQVTYIDKA